ncbi:Mediator complex, subunit Med11 [Cordyceps militaris CM01]|uniref:Mediator of RNA polymerase II transcription subunit 11 n=2 Tax=Cordyceps militaris TaxID=73501 RepID=G3JNX1_CORMM|nr:Mediator complex, subunit Med11 [Cordyceps militaris CM01]ATY63683.1 Mediator subunit Med11 [Cordyceps militaris]EGX89581.1 Mediator complex, subunit Med11 [Cordyceps militaris CM01]
MASPNDVGMRDGSPSGIHEPFTIEENISQLNAIDQSAVQLMSHAATALSSLTTPSSASSPAEDTNPDIDAHAAKAAFTQSTDSFLTALHDIDVRMKRQIMALEEAGIIDLGSGASRAEPHAATKASLRPNGVGAVGSLDVGWLNSRSTKVERDMEAELWDKAKKLLESLGNGQ